ncbi:MAG: rod shape-determining protein [Cyanobacteria bacterium NC_groundwater_1444_Ag_S-0.65um_54_12]|nr:rod shape-determining protein [Cyanobacteria bacterium NC_groundwater_1444_Ag_S-0.65um_54_12]
MDTVLALDIGTRTIVGLLATSAPGGRMRILDAAMIEHADRAMRDGQVHDVPEVGQRIVQVVETLALRNKLPLKRAAIAAAGRALRTVEVTCEVPVPRPGEITEAFLQELPIQGVATAIERLDNRQATRPMPDDPVKAGSTMREAAFHCVGISVVRYLLDGELIDNPLGQRGDRLEAVFIATFLPRVVTDGLLGALRRADLAVAGLTLEPIAAANAAIPPTMRALNLALVDVGAGTSDIALTRQGTITGYAMVPMAGDAVTEAIASAYLLDFPESERLKLAYAQQNSALAGRAISSDFPPPTTSAATLEATDVLGLPLAITPNDLQTLLAPVITELAQRIANEILALNGKAPAAVICIGGGSQTPGLAAALARTLGLPPQRVGVRGAEMVKMADFASNLHEGTGVAELLLGPAGVTPLGIAWGAIYQPGFRFRDVWVRLVGPLQPVQENLLGHLTAERRIQVLDLGRTTIFGALLATGIPARDLAGRPGMGMAVRIAGQLKLIAGTSGKPAEVKVNGEPAALDALLPETAHLLVSLATPGEDASATVGEVIDPSPFRVVIADRESEVVPCLLLNGQEVAPTTVLKDGDRLQLDISIGTILPRLGYSDLECQLLNYRLDGVDQVISCRTVEIKVNGKTVSLDYQLQEGDCIEITKHEYPIPLVRDIVSSGNMQVLELYLNGTYLEIPTQNFRVLKNGREVGGDAMIGEGDELRLVSGAPPIVADLLGLIQSELVNESAPGKQLQLQVNGAPAQFTTALCNGARIEARWVDIPFPEGIACQS